MNQAERNDLGKLIATIAVYYGKTDLSRPVISMYIDDLVNSGLSFSQCEEAYSSYRRNSKNTRFPIPSQIIEISRPQTSDDSLAREAAIRIQQAIAKYGYMSEESAQEFIGEIGWQVVRRFGGWRYVCENHGLELNPLTFHAQARDIAKAQIEMARAGIMNQAPQLDHAQNIQLEQNRSGLQRLDFNKLIETKERE